LGQQAATRRKEKLHVLIVDDELLIGRSLERVLSRDYEVTITTRARQAIEKIESGAWFDAILSDVTMPEMSGIEFHRWLLDAYPLQAERLAFVTGSAFGDSAVAHLQESGVRALHKPPRAQQVRALLHELTGTSEQPR
jgi:two-component system NtrC family sensor kinase